MTHAQYDDSTIPLRTDALIEERVHTLIGRATMRQLWLLFLDEDDIQLPLLIPIDGLPIKPGADSVASVVANIAALMEEIAATGLVVVWERYGPATLNAQDTAWAGAFASECQRVRVPLRASLLSHRTGVRWIAPDDYVGQASATR
jgi:hypothetical protein